MVIEFHADHVHSLKEKRHHLSSLKERLRQKFNIAVAETAHHDSWQQAQLSLATVSGSRQLIEESFQQAEKFIDENCAMQITSIHVDYW